MDAAEFITNLERQGFSLTPLPEGKLEVKPASKLTEELRAALKQRKAEILAILINQTAEAAMHSNHRDLYRRAAETVADECQLIDPHWLLEAHPLLWERLAALDNELTEMERSGADEQAYSLTLARLVAYVQKAQTLHEQEQLSKTVQ